MEERHTTQDYSLPPEPHEEIAPVESEPAEDYNPPQVPRQVDYAAPPGDEVTPLASKADKREALERAGLTDEKATP